MKGNGERDKSEREIPYSVKNGEIDKRAGILSIERGGSVGDEEKSGKNDGERMMQRNETGNVVCERGNRERMH